MKVGITGHQEFGPTADMRWLGDAMRKMIMRADITEGITSLARGADQLFADVLVENHIPIVAVFACDKIESTFERKDDLANFLRLRSLAVEVEVLPYDELSEEAYFAAGKRVVERCDRLLAVWDGKPARGLGGTGDVVSFARGIGRSLLHLNPYTREARDVGRAGA